MHQRGYLHFDLKTNNVLVAQNNGLSDWFW
jgi:tRNA A-37 threonylcarbamoyl transferase component Bud32